MSVPASAAMTFIDMFKTWAELANNVLGIVAKVVFVVLAIFVMIAMCA